MAAYTTSQAGNWSDQATWGGSGPPGNGDTATVAHNVTVDANTTVGTSPSDQTTLVLTVNNGITLTVAAGVTFIVRGNVNSGGNAGGGLVLSAGSILEFDASQAGTPATTYKWDAGRNFTGPAIVTANGTSGSHVTVRSNAGGGNGYFARGNGPVRWTCTYTDFLRIGDTTNNAIALGGATSSTDTFTSCTFDYCGRVNYGTTQPVSSGWDFTDCRWTNVTAINGVSGVPCPLRLNSATGTVTGSRVLLRCSFPNGTRPQLIGLSLDIDYCYFGSQWDSGANAAAWTGMDKCFIRSPIITGITNNGPVTNCYVFADGTLNNWHGFSPEGAMTAVSVAYDGIVFEGNGADANGDCIILRDRAGLSDTVSNCLVLPTDSGDALGTLVTTAGGIGTGAYDGEVSITHNTCPAGNQSALSLSEQGDGIAGHVPVFKSNLTWNSGQNAGSSIGAFHVCDTGNDQADRITPSGITHNCGYNLEAGSEGGGFDCNLSAAVGTGNISADPQFVDSTRNLASWAVTQGSVAATKTLKEADAMAYLAADPTLIDDLLAHVRGGFAPTNVALDGTAHDGGDIGAVAYTAGGDVTPPTLTARTIPAAGTTIVLTADEAITAGAGGNGGLTISASGGAVTATYASGDGTDTVTYNLSRTVYSGETVTCSYTQPGDGWEDGAGNDLATFADAAVTNDSTEPSPDVTPPTASDWAVATAGDEITATLSEAGCGPASGTGGFTLGGTAATVASWAISGTTLTLTLTGTVYQGETVTVSYDDATASEAIADAADNLLADIADAAVTNNSTATDTTPPTLTSPSAAPTGATTARLSIATDEGTGLWYAVVTASATAPDAGNVASGEDENGDPATWASESPTAVTGVGVKAFDVTGLTPGTWYGYIVQDDGATNRSTVAETGAFVLSAGVHGSIRCRFSIPRLRRRR